MRHLLRQPFAWALAGSVGAGLCGSTGCGKKSSASDAGAAARAPAAPASGSSSSHALLSPIPAMVPVDHRPLWLRDAGTRVPLITPIPMVSGSPAFAGGRDAGPPVEVKREPDWDLSADDPGRDYARRYAFFTKRYPDFDCVEFGPGVAAGDRKQVTVKTSASCPGGGAVRDVFLVDVAGDHLTVDDRTKRDPLARWPDGSDPEGPAGTTVRETTNMKGWKSPIQDALLKLSLAPLRMQSYGRGTYPVISIAAWRAPFTLNAPADAMQPLADALCAANDSMPMALVAGFDRSHLLRIRCPASSKWDTPQ
jgi:hypothetical protein